MSAYRVARLVHVQLAMPAGEEEAAGALGAPGFDCHSQIADSASGRLLEVLGERGWASRSTVGVESVPAPSPMEVELTFAARG